MKTISTGHGVYMLEDSETILKKYDDKLFDIAIFDPPYNVLEKADWDSDEREDYWNEDHAEFGRNCHIHYYHTPSYDELYFKSL